MTVELTRHVSAEKYELGYTRQVCAADGTDWPCSAAVMEECERLYLATGLPCNCGHHEKQEADR